MKPLESSGGSVEITPGGGTLVRPVRLRVEYVTNLEASLLSWAVFGVTIVMFGGIVAASVMKWIMEPEPVLFDNNDWYDAHVAAASFVMLVLLTQSALFLRNLWFTKRDNRVWNQRRWALTRDAATMLGIQVCSGITWLTAYSLVLVRKCYWFGDGVAWLAAIRWTCLNCQFLWMLIMAHGSTRYRGVGDPEADYQLLMDAPRRRQLKLHLPKLVLWVLMEACIILKLEDWLHTTNDRHSVDLCEEHDYVCSSSGLGLATTILMLVFTVAYGVTYLAYMRRAFWDHAQLPFAHYRLSNIYLRIMTRHGPAAFFTVGVTQVLLQLIHYDSCWSYTDMAMGALPIQVAMALLVSVQAILLMPKSPRSHDMLMAWLQELSWTEGDLAAAILRRNYRMRRAQFALSTDMFALSRHKRYASRIAGHKGFLESLRLRLGSARGSAPLANYDNGNTHHDKGAGQEESFAQKLVEEMEGGHAAWEQEPMFCMEQTIRLWSWAQYAYRHWWVDGGMDINWLLGLYGFTDYDAFRDEKSDTRSVLAWRDGCLLLSFRGTASTANAVTDVKAWMVPLLPKRYHHGVLVRVHAGFLQAYRMNEEQLGLIGRIQDIMRGFSPNAGLRIYVTGHSLGGALAVLAAQDLARSYPHAEISCCTFGAPKVGNSAFAAEFHKLVRDSFSVINDQDPVPRIPSTGFRCCGRRVVINGRGDIIVRPSYFERSVISRSGGSPAHHRMSRYALSIAQIIKAQFSTSKALPGGEEGAEALGKALDLGKTLLLSKMDPISFRDPAAQPEWLGVLGTKAQASERQGCDFSWCTVCDLCDAAKSSATASLEEEAEEGRAITARGPGAYKLDQPHAQQQLSPPEEAAAVAIQVAQEEGEAGGEAVLGEGQCSSGDAPPADQEMSRAG